MSQSDAEYRVQADAHRPAHGEGLASAARELARSGLTSQDIAAALRISAEAVSRLLEAATP